MVKLALKRTATVKEDPGLPVLQRISSLELPASEIAAQFPAGEHGGGAGMVCWCFAGDTVCDLFRIQGTLNLHGYHSILQRYAIPSGLHLVGLSIIFLFSTMTENIPPGYVSTILPRRVMECCIK